jgi:hypothetical protein
MARKDISFTAKDAALREDVHTLGGLVGEMLRDQGQRREREQQQAIQRECPLARQQFAEQPRHDATDSPRIRPTTGRSSRNSTASKRYLESSTSTK